MSVSGRKRVSKWDSKEEEDTEHLSGNDYPEQQHSRFYPEGNVRNGSSRRSAPDVDDDDEHLKSRQQQHPGEAWPPRSRGGGDAAKMNFYDSRKSSSEQDESRQRQPSRDRPRTRRSGSRSNSRSRSRSPVKRGRRDAGGGGSYDRHKARSGREVDGTGRYSRAGDHDWEPKNRKSRDASYYKEDSREQYPSRIGGRRSDYSSEDNNNSRRDVPEREYNRISSVPCRYFALGNCRNGTSCRFSHHGGPERKPQDEMFSRHDSNHSRWNERSDTGRSSEGAKGNNNGNWIDDMEMSPDWNYGVKTLKKPTLNEEKESLAPSYEHGSAEVISHQQVGDRRSSIGMFPTVGEKTAASSHHGFSNNSAPPIQAFNQIQSALPYQNTPLAAGGSQVLPPAAAAPTHLPENGNGVSREELNRISNISASLAQLFGNGQPITNLGSTLNPIQSMQLPQVYGQKEQSSHSQTDILSNNSIHTGVVPAVTALQINNSDSLVSLAENPKPSSEENKDKRRDEEASKEPDGRKTGKEEETEKVVEEEEDEDEDDVVGGENKKKEKDPKGMRAFKFSLVEIVKELLKPAWKEGGMNKDAYKNIVKKVVDKVTGAIQTGNIPQTQEKIDHYLSASKPKLTKLVQAYVTKVKKG